MLPPIAANTSNVISMAGTFSNLNLKSLDLSNLDTHNVSIMAGIFGGSTIDEIDLSTFDTTSLKNTSRMFSGLKTNKLIYIYIQQFDIKITFHYN